MRFFVVENTDWLFPFLGSLRFCTAPLGRLMEKKPQRPGGGPMWLLAFCMGCGYLTNIFFPFTTYTPAGSWSGGVVVRTPLSV